MTCSVFCVSLLGMKRWEGRPRGRCIGLCKPDHSKPDGYIPTTDKQAFTGQSFHLEMATLQIEGYL